MIFTLKIFAALKLNDLNLKITFNWLFVKVD